MTAKCEVARLIATDIDATIAAEISRLLTQLRDSPSLVTVGELRRVARDNFLVVAQMPSDDRLHVIGMACLVTMHLPQGIRFLIESVVVDETVRHQGVGTALMNELVAEARRQGDGHVSLTCNDTRAEAHDFYRDLGFKKAATSVLRLPLKVDRHEAK